MRIGFAPRTQESLASFRFPPFVDRHSIGVDKNLERRVCRTRSRQLDEIDTQELKAGNVEATAGECYVNTICRERIGHCNRSSQVTYAKKVLDVQESAPALH